MLITITGVEQAFTSNGAEYKKVSGVTSDGKEVTKAVFDNLGAKWSLLEENATLDFKMVKKGQFWNVADLIPVGGQLPPPTEPPTDSTPPAAEIIKTDGKNRSFALSYAKDWCIVKVQAGDKLTYMDVLTISKVFESYLDTGITKKKED